MKRFFAKLTKGRNKSKDKKREDENQQSGLSTQNEVLQSSMWNTISPQRTQRSIEAKSGDCRHPESVGHPGEQRSPFKGNKPDQCVVRNKHEQLKQRSIYEERNRADVTLDQPPRYVDSAERMNPCVRTGLNTQQPQAMTRFQSGHHSKGVRHEPVPPIKPPRLYTSGGTSSRVKPNSWINPTTPSPERNYDCANNLNIKNVAGVQQQSNRSQPNRENPHKVESTDLDLPYSSHSEIEPKIFHYHLTIRNCDGLEIHMDKKDQKVKQKTAYSADGRKLKRLSWIENPLNPVELGPPVDVFRTITETDLDVHLPEGNEDTVFISPEAESLFAENEQLVLQETLTEVHTGTGSGSVGNCGSVANTHSPLRSNPRMNNCATQMNEFSVHRHGSSQTDAPGQQSQYTQTTIGPVLSCKDQERQITAHRRATFPLQTPDPTNDTNIRCTRPLDESHPVSSQSNQYTNGGVLPHDVPNRLRHRRSRSTEREYVCRQRGIELEQPVYNPNVPQNRNNTRSTSGLPPNSSCISFGSERTSQKERPVGRVAPTVRRSRSLPRVDSSVRQEANLEAEYDLDDTDPATEVDLDLSSLSSYEELTPPSSPASTARLTPSPDLVTSTTGETVRPTGAPGVQPISRRTHFNQLPYISVQNTQRSQDQRGHERSTPHRYETIMDKLSRIKTDLIRMPGVLILGLHQGRIVITLSPERSNIEDIIRFMRHHNVPMHEYECGIVSHRYRNNTRRRPLQPNRALTCMVR